MEIFLFLGDFQYNSKIAVKKTYNILTNSENWKNAISIDAKVPLVRAMFNFKHFNIECDISFNNSLAICNTNLIKFFFQLQPLCKYL